MPTTHTTALTVAERLHSDFGFVVSQTEIARVLDDCARDLAGQAPHGAMPELTERLARARLSRIVNERVD